MTTKAGALIRTVHDVCYEYFMQSRYLCVQFYSCKYCFILLKYNNLPNYTAKIYETLKRAQNVYVFL